MIFVPSSTAKSRNTVARMYPGGVVIAKTDGGHTVFAGLAEYKTWRNQK